MADSRPTPPDPFRLAKVERRSYSPAPTSTPSLHPTEKALRDAVWRFLREKAGTAIVALLLGGGAGIAGRKAQEGASDEALRTAQADMARARTELQEAAEREQKLTKRVASLSSEVEDLSGAQKSLGEKVAKLRGQVETLEEARAVVVRAEPDRAPKP